MKTEGMEILVFENYPLSQIDKDFTIADFERAVKRNHVADIARAIVEGRMFDPVITVVKKGDKYEIIDGQHRITALKMLYEQGDLRRYTIIVKVLIGQDARQAYRALNSGKPLTLDDLLKSLDDGTLTFFEKLRPHCAFYAADPKKLPYSLLIRGFLYASRKPKERSHVLSLPQKIKPAQLEELVGLCESIKLSLGEFNIRKPLYKVPIFWNLMKIWHDYERDDLLDAHLKRFLTAAIADPEIQRLAFIGKRLEVLEEIETYLKKLWRDTATR